MRRWKRWIAGSSLTLCLFAGVPSGAFAEKLFNGAVASPDWKLSTPEVLFRVGRGGWRPSVVQQWLDEVPNDRSGSPAPPMVQATANASDLCVFVRHHEGDFYKFAFLDVDGTHESPDQLLLFDSKKQVLLIDARGGDGGNVTVWGKNEKDWLGREKYSAPKATPGGNGRNCHFVALDRAAKRFVEEALSYRNHDGVVGLPIIQVINHGGSGGTVSAFGASNTGRTGGAGEVFFYRNYPLDRDEVEAELRDYADEVALSHNTGHYIRTEVQSLDGETLPPASYAPSVHVDWRPMERHRILYFQPRRKRDPAAESDGDLPLLVVGDKLDLSTINDREGQEKARIASEFVQPVTVVRRSGGYRLGPAGRAYYLLLHYDRDGTYLGRSDSTDGPPNGFPAAMGDANSRGGRLGQGAEVGAPPHDDP